MTKSSTSIIGLKDLRENTQKYIRAVERGKTFVVVKKSKPIFRIAAVDDSDELWETVVDFSKIKKGGVSAKKILNYLS